MNKTSNLVLVFLSFLFASSLLSVSFLLLNLYDKNFNYINTKESITENIHNILYCDEVLTMSARMASITGDQGWIERYDSFVPQLDEAIKTSIQILPQVSSLMQEINVANTTLISLEEKSFELVKNNKKEEAFELLTSQEYKSNKVTYKQGIDNVVEQLAEYNHVIKQNIYNEFTNVISIIVIVIILSIVIAIYIVSYLRNYHNKLRENVEIQTKKYRSAKEDADASSRAKSIFLNNMSHEIRTPLNAILGFTEQLLKTENDTSKIKRFQIIQNSGLTLLNIINDILDYSEIENESIQLYPQATNLKDFIKSTSHIFEIASKDAGINFSVHFAQELPECIFIDAIHLKQILSNLLSNAIKFTRPKGVVTLDIDYEDENNTICFIVKDNGLGIKKEKIEKIFAPFEQEDTSTTRSFGGTGLGLSISKRLVSIMNGTLSVATEENKGSTFTVAFTFVECPNNVKPTTIQNNGIDNEKVDTFKGHALIVEDNKTNQMLLSFILNDLGMTYDIAENGQIATEKYTFNRKYNIILMDENMPVMNGIEAVKYIRQLEFIKEWPPVPIIAVTANALSGDRQRFLDAGMNDYVVKPYEEKRIKEVLDHYLK